MAGTEQEPDNLEVTRIEPYKGILRWRRAQFRVFTRHQEIDHLTKQRGDHKQEILSDRFRNEEEALREAREKLEQLKKHG